MRAWLTRDKAGTLVLWLTYGGRRPARLPKHEDQDEGWMGMDDLIPLPTNHPIGEGVTWEGGPVEVIIITKEECALEHARAAEKVNAAINEPTEERRKYALLRMELSCPECSEQFKRGMCQSCHEKLTIQVKKSEEETMHYKEENRSLVALYNEAHQDDETQAVRIEKLWERLEGNKKLRKGG